MSSSSNVIRTTTMDRVKHIVGIVKIQSRKLSERC